MAVFMYFVCIYSFIYFYSITYFILSYLKFFCSGHLVKLYTTKGGTEYRFTIAAKASKLNGKPVETLWPRVD